MPHTALRPALHFQPRPRRRLIRQEQPRPALDDEAGATLDLNRAALEEDDRDGARELLREAIAAGLPLRVGPSVAGQALSRPHSGVTSTKVMQRSPKHAALLKKAKGIVEANDAQESSGT